MKNILKTFDRAINKVGKKFVEKIQQELVNQNHIASGHMHDTMHYSLDEGSDYVELIIQSKADYVREVNEGQKPFDWDVSEIMNWMDDKDKNGKSKKFPSGTQERLQIAHLIAAAIAREGTPTKNSKEYSNNTYRRGFINRVVGSNERHFINDIDKSISTDINNIFKQLPKQV
jgi:hypothetical protein